jgi:cytochrome c
MRPAATASTVAAAALALVAALPVAAADAGQAAFNNHCRTCHSTKAADNRLGPSLFGIYGAKAGTTAGYGSFSQGLRESGITWDDANLDRFIANPDGLIANNNMKPYAGIRDAAVRMQIVAFLKSLRREQ